MSDPFDGDSFDSVMPQVKIIEEAKAAKDKSKSDTLDELREERNIIERAKSMEQYMNFRVMKNATQAAPCDENMFIAFDTLFGKSTTVNRPHLDEFRGILVDHEGVKINGHYSVKAMLSALSYAGLKGFASSKVREGLREYALACRQNDLCIAIEARMPQWDGESRLDRYLWTLFRSFDTPFNRLMSRYFWTSFYMRCMHPGSDAPIVISLIGDQMSGKSFFSKRLVQITTGNKELDSVKLNLQDSDKFLRQITGNSNVATIPEMRGYQAADHARTKEFVTQTCDNFDQKFEPNIVQQRQWIIMMDSNKYDGLLRDDTGNRRFAPIFVAQIPDQNNKPAWEVKHSEADGEKFNAGPFIASAAFEEDVWQLFAEARAWVEKNGLAGYAKLVEEAATAVQHFSDKEVKRDSGTIGDRTIDTYLDHALENMEMSVVKGRKGNGDYLFAAEHNLTESFKEVSNDPHVRINPWKLVDAIKARGGVEGVRTKTKSVDGEIRYGGVATKGFKFVGLSSKAELVQMLAKRQGTGEGDVEEVGETADIPKGDGPF